MERKEFMSFEISNLLSAGTLMGTNLNNSTNSCDCSNKGTDIFSLVVEGLLLALSQRSKQNNALGNQNETMTDYLDNLSYMREPLNNYNMAEKVVNVTSKDGDTKARIENAVALASKKYGVSENLIKAIIKVESNFNPNTVSSAGAKGLMQLMPENCRDLNVKNPFNIEENIDGGTRHIKEYLDLYKGDVKMALMAYNGGPTRMKKRGVVSPDDIYKMPKETQNYVPKVMKHYLG
ncbi:lytic transglycosylase domain-containing protein [Metaclostridioides mangenotii]|uniref:Soluble lytic murein transglycosylase-like protein n=1 Tax=Metaclostridioides mangenotii TaxID=1540 RepID=A0ABS4ECK7_9FIRM|nr:lytic transglycosylase domain-containing protein [Clostridioides mangenotii]MBP1855670.1 soluble lytic murein transglycosylase-like protein [Clostridioides mangenotii]